jgi:hypothetical protein
MESKYFEDLMMMMIMLAMMQQQQSFTMFRLNKGRRRRRKIGLYNVREDNECPLLAVRRGWLTVTKMPSRFPHSVRSYRSPFFPERRTYCHLIKSANSFVVVYLKRRLSFSEADVELACPESIPSITKEAQRQGKSGKGY